MKHIPMKKLTTTLCLTVALLFGSISTSFALPPCPSDQTQRYHNCFGTYTSANGNKYVGEWKDDKKHGQGTLYAADRTVKKQGVWEDDEFQYAQKEKSPLPPCPSDQTQRYHNCFGTYTFGPKSKWAGDKYVGEFKDDKKHGQGTYSYASGDKYVGEFKDGKSHGQGTYSYASGDKYVGEFKDDKKHGQGTYTFADGDKYFGEYRDGKRQGQGTLYAADGAVKKQGIWKDDKFLSAPKAKQGVVSKKTSPGAAPVLLKCNKSSPKWHNCDGSKKWGKGTYYGRFMNNKPHGRGTITNTDKWQYVGQFRNGKKHGPGLLIDPDGGEYPERYNNGKKLLH